MNEDPIKNPPQKLYDPHRYDVGHWNNEEVYVYESVVDAPEGELISYEDLKEFLDGYYSPGEVWFTKSAALEIQYKDPREAFLCVFDRDDYLQGKEQILFATPDMKAIRYLTSLPSMVPSVGEDSDITTKYED